MTSVKTTREIKLMREGGRMLATVLEKLRQDLAVGMSTKDLAEIAKKELRSLGGQPAFLGYQGFPDVLCVSVNDEVVHGIPSTKRIIEKGDIVSMDFGVTHGGLVTDAAISVVAEPSQDDRIQSLISATLQALMAGISAVHDNVRVGDIACAVQEVLDGRRYGIVRDLVGHGVGHHLHEAPNISNYGRKGTGPYLKAGMTIAIEPMATLGGHGVYIADDGWTVRTKDQSLAAHFEHTVLITPEGPEILTEL